MAENFCLSLIKQDIMTNCPDRVTKGIEANGVIINRSDIDFGGVVFDETKKNVIKTLKLKPGVKAYDVFIQTKSPFNNTKTTLEVGANRSSFTHEVGMVVLDNDPDVCENIIDPIANGDFVVIYENKFKNFNKPVTPGDSSFQIVGFYQGLRAQTLENDKYSDDTEGGWNVLLKEEKSSKAALFMYDTDYATTKAAIETLTVIA